MQTIHAGSKGDFVKKLQTALNRRLKARSAPGHMVKVDGEFGPKTRSALVYAAYLLGADKATVDGMRTGTISPEEQKFILNPGLRDKGELARARKRVAAHRKAVAAAKAAANKASAKRKRIVAEAKKAAANYRKNPGAYHYLAGGSANTVYLKPTPRSWRSDCSQFAAAVYKGAGLPSPAAPLDHQWASTFSIVKSPHARFISKAGRKPGDLGMYGSHEAPHHVEIWCGDGFIGHGSPPIDSLTPGEPDYYVTFDFLN
jgi:cell wall-associated NlpC family hydrolase